MSEGWIVVVDDSPIDLRSMQVLLAAAGYEVRTARDTKAAAQLLTVFPPRLMLVDFRLPASRRVEYVKRLRTAPETRDIAIIAMIPRAMKGLQQVAREAGCSECVAKPIDTVTLLETVARRLRTRNAQS
jgi:CheY-like chemotaxis protein